MPCIESLSYRGEPVIHGRKGSFKFRIGPALDEKFPPKFPQNDMLDERRDQPIFRPVPKYLRINSLDWYWGRESNPYVPKDTGF